MAATLRSVLEQRVADFDVEFIVADGQSDDGTREVLNALRAEDPRLVVIDNPERTTPAGLNRAIRAARGSVIVRMDVHSEYGADYLAESIKVLDETGAANVGGPARTRAEGLWQRAIAAAYHSRWSTGGAKFHDPNYEGPVDTVTLGCWRREIFDELGLFDEELIRNQDDELNLRIVRAGKTVWQSPRIEMWYRPRATVAELFRQYHQYGYWKVRVIQKHKLPASVRHLVPGLFVVSLGGLALIAPVCPPAAAALGIEASLYGALLLGASVTTAMETGWDLLPVLPVVFATYHAAYGLGFLAGAWDFGVRGGARRSAFELSRGPARSTSA